MKIQPFGDSSLLISFEDKISEQTHRKVISLFQLLDGKKEVTFQIPAYNSLTVGINLNLWNLHEATIYIREHGNLSLELTGGLGKNYIIPVCYHDEFAPDIQALCESLNLTTDELIGLHTAKNYRVFMLGFVAGFAYLGTLNKKLDSPRKKTPRLKVPSGSVGLAGLQTGIYPTEAPGGWQIIGRTPLEMFSAERDDPTLLKPGDTVSFRPITKDEFRLIQLKIETGIFEMEVGDE